MPIDFSDVSVPAIEYAASFARHFGAVLVLLHVVEPAGGSEHYQQINPTLDESSEQLVEAGRDRLQAICGKQLEGRIPCEVLVRIGRAPSEITDTAKALGVDLIIMSTHGYSSPKQAPMGSTTDRVVRQAACPVLTIRTPAR